MCFLFCVSCIFWWIQFDFDLLLLWIMNFFSVFNWFHVPRIRLVDIGFLVLFCLLFRWLARIWKLEHSGLLINFFLQIDSLQTEIRFNIAVCGSTNGTRMARGSWYWIQNSLRLWVMAYGIWNHSVFEHTSKMNSWALFIILLSSNGVWPKSIF